MGETITDEQLLEDVIYELAKDFKIVEEKAGESNRWSTPITVIFQRESDSKYFRTRWERGNTEYQENELPKEAHEVLPHKEMIEVTRWKKA